ncbi:MAG: response regulator [Clostridiales bacterium]|nr:response regulator [Clostridiales bacterium]
MEDNCKIMIIDDEFIMRQGIRYMMDWEKEGYEVIGEASNGKEALDLLDRLHPHIILCDIVMPVMDGLDFIKIVSQKYPETQVIVLSGYDRFDYVRQALLNGAADYVLKPTLNPEELLNVVERVAKNISGLQLKRKELSSLDSQLERYLTGYDMELHTWKFESVFPYSHYRLFLLPLHSQNDEEVDMSLILYEKTEKFLKDMDYCRSLKFLLNQEVMYVALNYNLKDESRLLNEFYKFMQQLSQIQDKVMGVMGFSYTKIEDLKKDFQMPEFMKAEIFYHKGENLYLLEKGRVVKSYYEKFNFRKFVTDIAEHKYKEAIEMFRAYIYQAAEGEMVEFKIKNQTKNLLYNVMGSSEEQVDELEEIRKEYFKKIDHAPYCEEFLIVLEEMLKRIEQVMDEKDEKQNIYLKKILEYIQEHYREELDLQNLADKFGFSYSYLSSYFNTHMGEGFSEYLNHVRIQKACELLQEKQYSIAQISSLVGYSDHSYFCRVFKKITGKTPSGYRRERR